jgi:5-formyltetrahydrofolate cyclo-ligase
MLHHDLAPELHWHQVAGWEQVIVPGPFGPREPDPLLCPRVEAAEIECVFVPGVAFDRDGFRLGRGSGFYDRLLGDFPKLPSTGLMYAAQELERVPREPHDQALRALLTEDGLRTF